MQNLNPSGCQERGEIATVACDSHIMTHELLCTGQIDGCMDVSVQASGMVQQVKNTHRDAGPLTSHYRGGAGSLQPRDCPFAQISRRKSGLKVSAAFVWSEPRILGACAQLQEGDGGL
jgi:hypothetical protein